MQRLAAFLDRSNLSAILLSRHENIAWITGGQVEARVAVGSKPPSPLSSSPATASATTSLPGMRPRALPPKNSSGLGYEPVLYPWYESPAPLLHELAGGTARGSVLGSDTPIAHAQHVNLTSLRAPLLPAEIARLRTLSRQTADVNRLCPRIPSARHHPSTKWPPAPPPHCSNAASRPPCCSWASTTASASTNTPSRAQGVLERYGMVNLCARKWGLVVSITRFVHFGPVPDDLAASFVAAARIHSELLHATRPGATSAQLFDVAHKAYTSAGAAEEIELHHQGGPCGYTERDWLITPTGEETVALPQAFAYNPSLRGAKAEDTALATEDAVEILTETPTLPVIETVLDGVTYRSAGVLQR